MPHAGFKEWVISKKVKKKFFLIGGYPDADGIKKVGGILMLL